MKFLVSAITLLMTFSTFASLSEDLQSKQCSVKFNKTVFVNESDSMTEFGRVMFAPLINERNLLLRKGQQYPILESDEEVIVIGERENLVFLCVVDNSQECVKLSSLGDNNLAELSEKNLEVICD